MAYSRFTVKDDVLCAIALAWPGREASVTTVWEKLYREEIERVSMLGADGDLRWTYDEAARAQRIETPSTPPCDYAYVFKIERRRQVRRERVQ